MIPIATLSALGIITMYLSGAHNVHNFASLMPKYRKTLPKSMIALEGLDPYYTSLLISSFERVEGPFQALLDGPDAVKYLPAIPKVMSDLDDTIVEKIHSGVVSDVVSYIETIDKTFMKKLEIFVQNRLAILESIDENNAFINSRLGSIIAQMEEQIDRFDKILGPINFAQIDGSNQFSLVCPCLKAGAEFRDCSTRWIKNAARVLRSFLDNSEFTPTSRDMKLEADAQRVYLYAIAAEERVWEFTDLYDKNLTLAHNFLFPDPPAYEQFDQMHTLAVKAAILRTMSILYNKATDLLKTLPTGIARITHSGSGALREFKTVLRSRINSAEFQGQNSECIPQMEELEKFALEIPDWLRILSLSFTVTREDTQAAIDDLNAALLKIPKQVVLWQKSLPTKFSH